MRWFPSTHLAPDLVISLLSRSGGQGGGAERGVVSAGFRTMTATTKVLQVLVPGSCGGSGCPVMVADRVPTKNAACSASQFLCTHICYREQAVKSQRPRGFQGSKDSRLFWQRTILRACGLCGVRGQSSPWAPGTPSGPQVGLGQAYDSEPRHFGSHNVGRDLFISAGEIMGLAVLPPQPRGEAGGRDQRSSTPTPQLCSGHTHSPAAQNHSQAGGASTD